MWVKGFDGESTGYYVKQGFKKHQKTGEENDIYHHETKQFCIWWNSAYRHWWLGPCKNVAENVGIAYLNLDTPCPNDGFGGDWRKSGTNNPILSGLVLDRTTL